ncbi:hypothetical protein ATO6_02535 [Oceanicola sp. 22II-s10i]|uniref:hypothetical protein n=1 Tax=Oceanicola sp. 22II-s10i TaxID=1317116 RepID=UPI000B51F306|nr:hypothetical protein [Oceanicola sp. 22II-s10i]OWU85805.1 hypothetical protein ATO6_02535 [Oceanicola sp. 22II-s10i]
MKHLVLIPALILCPLPAAADWRTSSPLPDLLRFSKGEMPANPLRLTGTEILDALVLDTVDLTNGSARVIQLRKPAKTMEFTAASVPQAQAGRITFHRDGTVRMWLGDTEHRGSWSIDGDLLGVTLPVLDGGQRRSGTVALVADSDAAQTVHYEWAGFEFRNLPGQMER